MAALLDISLYKRVPFDDDVAIIGGDLTGSTFLMHIRNRPGDIGSPLIALNSAVPPSEGVSVTYNSAYQYQDGAELITAPASLIRIIINETTLEALSLGTPADVPIGLHYDLHVTPPTSSKRVQFGGKFILKPGVTI